MLCLYLFVTEIPDSGTIIYKVQIRDSDGGMHRVPALINCGATGIMMAHQLFK